MNLKFSKVKKIGEFLISNPIVEHNGIEEEIEFGICKEQPNLDEVLDKIRTCCRYAEMNISEISRITKLEGDELNDFVVQCSTCYQKACNLMGENLNDFLHG